MSSIVSPPSDSSVTLSEAYQNWSPTQPWLAEVVRTVATTLYAKTAEEDSENRPCSIHRSAISGQVGRTLGAVLDETTPLFSISWIIDLLIQLQDFAMTSHGYCLPRESRITRLTRGWGRIAGGLPLSFSEHPDAGVKKTPFATVGRVVQLDDDFDAYDRGTEHSEVFSWISKSAEQIFSLLNQDLPQRYSSEPIDGTMTFYHAELRRSSTRGDRWQNRMPADSFVIARTTGIPVHYFVSFHEKGLSGRRWIEVNKEQARKWVLLAEKCGGAKNIIRAHENEDEIHLRLPDMLPSAWTTAWLACSTTVLPTDRGWDLTISRDIVPLIHAVAQSANIELV